MDNCQNNHTYFASDNLPFRSENKTRFMTRSFHVRFQLISKFDYRDLFESNFNIDIIISRD